MSQATMPQQYQPAPPAPPQQPVRKNGLGITALVLGLVGVPLAFIPLAGPFLGIPLGFLALAFAVFGVILALRGRAGKGLPIAGAVLGVASMAIGIGQATVLSNAFNDASAGTDTAVTAPEKPGAEQPAAKAGIGDTVTDGDLAFTVTNVQTGVASVGGEYGQTADGQYVIVEVTVKNVGQQPATFDDSSQYVYNAEGHRFASDTGATMTLDDGSSFLNQINPGNTVHGKIAFDMPEGSTPTSIQLHGDMLSQGVTVNLT